MEAKLILKDITKIFHTNSDKYLAHTTIKRYFEELCNDTKFIHEAIKDCISKPNFFKSADNLSFHLIVEGDVIISINLFTPIYDKAKDITQDNIHHHGWRLLTTGIISGKGYDTINFVKKSHEQFDGDKIHLKIEKNFIHTFGKSRFLDSDQAHVIFHPESTCATLALWSANKNMSNQKIKYILKNYPKLSKFTSNTIHKIGLNKLLGLNEKNNVQFIPKNGNIILNPNPAKEIDGPINEIIPCMFKFFQQIKLKDDAFFNEIKKNSSAPIRTLCDRLISDKPIADIGIRGDIKKRFTKKEILNAMAIS
jgi:hypothetical protein